MATHSLPPRVFLIPVDGRAVGQPLVPAMLPFCRASRGPHGDRVQVPGVSPLPRAGLGPLCRVPASSPLWAFVLEARAGTVFLTGRQVQT